MGLALWTGQFDVARELLEAGTLYICFEIDHNNIEFHYHGRC